jgi:hypothetical protein
MKTLMRAIGEATMEELYELAGYLCEYIDYEAEELGNRRLTPSMLVEGMDAWTQVEDEDEEERKEPNGD